MAGTGLKKNGTWVDLSKPFVKKSGAWVEVAKVFAKKAGQWIEAWTGQFYNAVQSWNATTGISAVQDALSFDSIGNIYPRHSDSPNYTTPVYSPAGALLRTITTIRWRCIDSADRLITFSDDGTGNYKIKRYNGVTGALIDISGTICVYSTEGEMYDVIFRNEYYYCLIREYASPYRIIVKKMNPSTLGIVSTTTLANWYYGIKLYAGRYIWNVDANDYIYYINNNASGHALYKFSWAGVQQYAVGLDANSEPYDIAIDPQYRPIIANMGGGIKIIQRYTPGVGFENITSVSGQGFFSCDCDPDGNIYGGDWSFVKKVDINLNPIWQISTSGNAQYIRFRKQDSTLVTFGNQKVCKITQS